MTSETTTAAKAPVPPPEMCQCGHGSNRHGPASGGCVECWCVLYAPDAEPSAPEWERRRTAVLGEFVGCGRPHCRNAEWETQVAARGWEEQGDGTWACPECVEAAERGDDQ